MADDEVPTIDAIDGWPIPEAQPDWVGSTVVEATLRQNLANGRMHHAWLVTGTRGVGKATLAFRFARFALTYGNGDRDAPSPDEGLATDPSSRVFRQVASQAHPNILTLRRPWDEKTKRYRTELTVDEVRRMHSFFGSTAGEGRWRICIVDTADDMNISAANALLKMLEEPPPRSIFFLLTSRPGQLLPTIRSRCRRLDLDDLPAETIEAALRRHGDGTDEIATVAARLAGGSLRRAILLLQGDGIDTYRQFQRLVSDLPRIDFTGVHDLADRIAGRGEEDSFRAFLDTVEGWIWRRVRSSAEPDGSPVAPAAAVASLATWAELWEKVTESSLLADEYNLDRKQLILQIFMALSRATRQD